MLDPLGIVKPVKRQNDLGVSQSVAKHPGLLLHRVTLHTITNLPVVDAHWERVDLHRSFPVDEHLAKIVLNSQNAKYASEEMLSVVDCMESDQVSPKNPFQYGPTPSRRECAEHVVRGEWCVEK